MVDLLTIIVFLSFLFLIGKEFNKVVKRKTCFFKTVFQVIDLDLVVERKTF